MYDIHDPTVLYDRFLQLGSISSGIPNSKIRPILSAEAQPLAAPSNYTGLWMTQDVRNNIFAAEMLYYDDWSFDAFPNGSTGTAEAISNDVDPGASQWFSSEYMVQPLQNTIIFRSNPVFTTGTTGSVSFTYQGPIENKEEWNEILNDITYEFWITEPVNNSTVFTIGTPKTMVPYERAGTFSNSTALTKFNVDVASGFSNGTLTATGITTLPNNSSTPYKAHMKINYPGSSCSMQHDQDVMICDEPSIISLSPSTNVCYWTPVHLRAVECTGANFQWHRIVNGIDNIISSNGTSKDYIAMESGEYYCVLTNSSTTACNGPTNHIEVTVNPLPPLATNFSVSCSGSNVTLSAIPTTGGTYEYRWSDNSTNSQLTIPYPTTIDNVISVTITTQGTTCSRNKTISLPFKTKVTTSGEFCTGSTVTLQAPTTPVQTTNFAGELLSNYLWSPGGETTSSIGVTTDDVYSVTAIGVTSQCLYSEQIEIEFDDLPIVFITA